MPQRSLPSRVVPLAWAGLALLTLLGALAPRADAAEFPKKTYRDKVHKFSLKVFDDWQQIPLEASETTVVAKFGEAGADRGRFIPAELTVVRVAKGQDAKQPAVTGEVPERLREFLESQRPKSAWDATVGALPRMYGHYGIKDENLPKPEDGKSVKSTDKVEGKMWSFTLPIESGWGDKEEFVCVFASFEKDEIEYGVFLQCGRLDKSKYQKGFEKVVKTFKFFDDKAEDVESLDVLEGVNISAKRRSDIEKGMVQGWNVIVSTKKNYIIVYNTKNNRNHQLAQEIARRIELIREQVYEVQFPPAKPIDTVSIVRVCGDAREYHQYGGPGGSAGYWNSGAEELVFYDASPSRKIDDNTVAVLYHEAFHQYIFYSVGDVAPHSWFNEGHGDYYAGAELVGRGFKIKPFDWRRGTIKNAVVHGPRALTEQTDLETGKKIARYENDGGYTPLKDLVRFSQGEYYSYPGICYAQGWSLIYFLREVVPKNRTYREKWGKILDTYFDVLQREVNKEERPPALGPDGNPQPPPPVPPDGPDGGGQEPPTPPTEPGDGTSPGGGEKPDGGGEPDPGDGGEDEEPVYMPALTSGRWGSAAALNKAVDEAFKDVDWAELEEAWAKAVKKDM